jgi:hypothetical protein
MAPMAPMAPRSDLQASIQPAAGYYAPPTTLSTFSGAAVVSQLVVVRGPHAGSVFMLTHGAIMGRDERCDIALIGDTHLSRQHARFVLEGSIWVVEDGNSMNGLYVNNVRVGRHVLAPGDQIFAGETALQVA